MKALMGRAPNGAAIYIFGPKSVAFVPADADAPGYYLPGQLQYVTAVPTIVIGRLPPQPQQLEDVLDEECDENHCGCSDYSDGYPCCYCGYVLGE